MNINIVAVGKIKDGYLSLGIAEYLKRLSGFCKLSIDEVADYGSKTEKPPDIERAKQKESALILPKLKGYTVLLDIQGAALSSPELAGKIKALGTAGKGELTFVVGGSYGVNQEVRDKADFSLSFGSLTYPHQLVRLMLLEQLYRAFCINAGHPYHK